MQHYYSSDGIQIVQNIGEVQIDFDSGRYSVPKTDVEKVGEDLQAEGGLLSWNFDFVGYGHIRSYFDARDTGPIRANETAMRMVDYIKGCAIAGP